MEQTVGSTTDFSTRVRSSGSDLRRPSRQMGFFDTVLWPLKVAVAWIMVQAHDALTFLGMDPAGGWTWVLSIVALVVVIRVLLIPLFVRQIKASRGMQVVQPEIQKLQKKYKGKTDPASRQAMQQEMSAIYKEAGTSPFASCLPLIAQMPVFFALYRVLYSLPDVASGSYHGRDSIGPLTKTLAAKAESSTIFGAPLASSFMGDGATLSVRLVTATLIVLMSATTLFTQRQLTMKNMPAASQDSPMARQQKMMMYIFPLIFLFIGVQFPMGVLIYWTTSNLWTLGQQFIVIRNSPTPGSEAEKKYLERKAKKAKSKKSKGISLEDDGAAIEWEADSSSENGRTRPGGGQRHQRRRNAPRSKRKGKGAATG